MSAGDRRDVLVVGGGPAGASLACFLRRQGCDVVLIDAARFPRDKICGEAVSPRAWPLLEAMGAADRVRALDPHALRGMRLTSPDGTTFQGEYPRENPPGLAVRRLELDAALLAHARDLGTEVHEGIRATGLLWSEGIVDGVEAEGPGGVPARWRARLVVGADGRHSTVATRLHLRRPRTRLRRFAVRGLWDGVAGLDAFGEMHVGGGGYCGVAPLGPAFANVAFVLPEGEMHEAGGDLEGFHREALRRRWPRVAERLEGARLTEPPRAIGPLAVDTRAVAAPGALLVGDAAGFYDPFTGEGVTLALSTARIAATVAAEALKAPDAAAHLARPLEGYTRARHAATRDKFRFNRLLQIAVGWPEAGNLVARRLARRPDLADQLVGVAGDFVPARTALGLRFLWGLLRA